MNTLTDADFAKAAEALNCDVPAIRAVATVESGGRTGFLNDGRPMILFEAHIFSRLTGHKYDASHPNISSLTWNKALYKGGAGEWDRMAEAGRLNTAAAMKSTSWGMFQILGQNYALCGYPDWIPFVNDMKNAGEQLLAFVAFVKSAKLDDELRTHNWAGFARGYNGTAYRENQYDTKLADAYARIGADIGYGNSSILRIGDAGADVQYLQRGLTKAGFPLNADGNFGRATQIAVQKFQVSKGLTDDGVVGTDTWGVLLDHV